MGATAVLEIAAETPPATKSLAKDVISIPPIDIVLLDYSLRMEKGE
jgi:hypothetical protein